MNHLLLPANDAQERKTTFPASCTGLLRWKHAFDLFRVVLLILTAQSEVVAQGVCDRTPQVRDKLVEVTGVSTCGAVTTAHLAAVTRLDLEREGIPALQAHDFRGLSSLKNLSLRNNSLRELPEGIFNDLDNLTWLSLEENFLSQLSGSVFKGLDDLEGLALSINQLSALPAEIFKGLSNLDNLFFAGNSLTTIPETVFQGLGNLSQLSLAGNPLGTLPEEVFQGLSNLKYLYLDSSSLFELPPRIFNGLNSLQDLSMLWNPLWILPQGIFDDVLDTLNFGASDGFFLAYMGPLQTLSFRPPSQTVYEDTTVTAKVSLSGALPMAIRVPFSVAGSAAMESGTSFSPHPADGLLFLAGETSKEITVTLPEGGSHIGKTVLLTLGELSQIDLFRSDGSGPRAPHLNGETVLFSDSTGSVHTMTIVRRDRVSDTRGVCGRTPQVRDELMAVTGASACAEVTPTHLAAVTLLDLSDTGITAIQPDDFDGLRNLTDLYLSRNILQTLPRDVFKGLTNLESLQLSSNLLSELPKGIFSGLSNLQLLNLGFNLLTELPDEAFNGLNRLIRLRLNSNRLTRLPEDIFSGLDDLQSLKLSFNFLTELPADAFSGLSSLRDLALRDNLLSGLSEGVFNGLSKLEALKLHGNLLRILPERIFQGLHILEALTLGRMPLNRLPEGIFKELRNLKMLEFFDSSLTELPKEVFQDLDSLKRLNLSSGYLRNLPDGIFRGLSKLEVLDLVNNGLRELSPGIFHGLDSIKEIDLQGSRLQTLPIGVFDDVLDTLGDDVERSLIAGETIFFLILFRSKDPIDFWLKAGMAFSAAEQSVVEGAAVRVPVTLSRALPVAVRVPYTIGASGILGGLTGLSPDPDSGLLIPAGETRKEIVFRVPKAAGSQADGTVVVTLGKPTEIGLRRSDGTGPDAPYLPTKAFLIPADDAPVHTVTITDSDTLERDPYCLSLWPGSPCSTVASLPHVVAGPLGENRAATEVIITHRDPEAGGCEAALLFHRGTSLAPPVSFNGHFPDENLLRLTIPQGGARILSLEAPDAEEPVAGAAYLFARSPCTADSLHVQGRALLENKVDGEIAEMFAIAAQTPGDWMAGGDCRVLTGVFGNGRNVGFAAVTAEPGQSAPSGTRFDFQAFDLEGNIVGLLPGLEISGDYQAESPWSFDDPMIVEMCLDVPGESRFELAVTAIGTEAEGGGGQFSTEAFPTEPEPLDTVSGP